MPDSAPDMNDPRFSRDLSLDRQRHQVAALLAMLEAQGCGDDDQLILDVIEGETDAMEAISKVLRMIGESASLARSLKDYEGDLATRRKRYETRVDVMRRSLLAFMQEFGLKKIERPEATLSMSPGKPSVGFAGDFDARNLPEDCQRVSVDADKARVKERLEAGEDLPGCFLTNGSTSLTVRTK